VAVFLVDLMAALAVALLLTVVFAAGLGSSRLGPNWLIFFALVLLAAWAGGVWIPPVGPPVLGMYWVPFLFIGLVVAVLWAVTHGPRRVRPAAPPRPEAEEEVGTTFSVLVWILMIGLAIAVLLAYV
jgi:hypothetical protein